jgi:hypothetical protein
MARGNNQAGGKNFANYDPKNPDVYSVFQSQRFAAGSSNAPVISASQISFGNVFNARPEQMPAGKADFGFGSMVGNGLAKVPVDLSKLTGTLFSVFTGARVKGSFRRSA